MHFVTHPGDATDSAQAGSSARSGSAEAQARAELTALLRGVDPWDDLERAHLAEAAAWAGSRAPLYRTRKPDVPSPHLVSYFVVLEPARQELLLVAHRKAGLWLPAGGHVEPLEHPWQCTVRECREELHIQAVAAGSFGERPFFLTVTQTRGPGSHTDVSLWFLLQADAVSLTSFDHDEFGAIAWLSPDAVLAHPIDELDPHMHRFTRKLLAASRPWTSPSRW